MSLILWSGGCDSTLLLFEESARALAAGEAMPRAISITYNQIPAAEQHRTARRRILQELARRGLKIDHTEFELQRHGELQVDTSHGGLAQPILWLGIAQAFLDVEEDLMVGYIRGDDIWHYKTPLLQAFEATQAVLEKTGKLQLPLEWLAKDTIIKDLSTYGLLKQVLELRGKGGANAYKRSMILVDVYEKSDFIEQECGGDALDAERKLDAYVEDLCLSFMELRDMLKHFPKASQWKAGRLRTMHREMIAAHQAAKQAREPKRPRSDKPTAAEQRLLNEQRSREAYRERQVESRPESHSGPSLSLTIDREIPGAKLESVEPTRSAPVPRRGLDLWSTLSDDERRYLIDAPEFQAWCRGHGFEIAPLKRLALAGN